MQLCVYCSSSNHLHQRYVVAAQALGAGMARRGWGLVYGGGSVGLMGAVALSVQAHGGRVVGIIPQALLDREIGFLEADELIVTTTMRERKRLMDERADAIVTLPGGFGTLEELLEMMTLRQLAYHDKPIIIVNLDGFFDPLLAMFERIFAERFTDQRYRRLFTVVPTPDAALALLDGFTPPAPPADATASEFA
ncbi:MAG: TIGR00730 family Rossman fold protein [Roseiflexaceae bacterium]|nr:TIGR00730 family Rossman fold protein [Roseiflexaceae bacterium]